MTRTRPAGRTVPNSTSIWLTSSGAQIIWYQLVCDDDDDGDDVAAEAEGERKKEKKAQTRIEEKCSADRVFAFTLRLPSFVHIISTRLLHYPSIRPLTGVDCARKGPILETNVLQ